MPLGFGHGRSTFPIDWPRVSGHEVVGRIDAVGSWVQGWAVGQRVGVGFLDGFCGHCDYCRNGDLVNCRNQGYTGIHHDGGYAEAMIAKASGLVSIPDDLSSAAAAPLLCAGLTTFSALRNSPAKAGDLVAVLGIGGLGHLAVQYARHMGFEVVAIDRGKNSAELAKSLGAHHYIDSTATDAAKTLEALGAATVILSLGWSGCLTRCVCPSTRLRLNRSCSKIEMLSRGTLVFVASAVLVVSTAAAQTTTPDPARRYPRPTYDENWQFLSDPNRHVDPWDIVKYVPFADGIFASFGGEARESYERFGNQDFGLSVPSPNGYLLQRYLLHSDIHLGSRLRVWAELNSSFEDGRVGGPRPVIDEDKLDLHQAFVESEIVQGPGVSVRVRTGRQEIAVGSGRLYALREGPNVPLSFDGVRAIAQTGSWRFDAWAARPVTTTPGVFDDASHHQFGVWGAYVTKTGPAHASVDAYYLGWDRQNARFDKGVANELRHTLGARLWRSGPWAYDAEGMYQFGSFGVGNIRAWRGVVEASRGLAVQWNPRVGIDFDVASGDRDRSSPNLGTFNSFFQSGTYSGRAQLLGPNNSIRLEPTLTLAPRRNVSVSAGWGFYWRESEQDGLYGIPGNVVFPSNGVPGHYEGSRPIVEGGWTLNPHLSLHVDYIFVFNAQFEERSLHATTSESYISPWITYRF